MEELLNHQERRRLKIIQILDNCSGWITSQELAERLNCSLRILKDDLAYFRINFNTFQIQSSHLGIRLKFENESGLMTVYQEALARFIKFHLFEIIFFNEKLTAKELADILNISQSSVYRIVEQINSIINKKYNLYLSTSPCQLVGEEKTIRSFYYRYFNEKYPKMNLLFKNHINISVLQKLLRFFITFTQFDINFAYFSTFELISTINLIRLLQGHKVNTSDIKINFDQIIPDLSQYDSQFNEFENCFGIKINNDTINQLFTAFVSDKFSISYERLKLKALSDKHIEQDLIYINDFLDKVSDKYQLLLPNKEDCIFALHNSIYLEELDIRSNYILYNQNKLFVDNFKQIFPMFYPYLREEIIKLRTKFNLPLTTDGINYLSYIVITYWENIIPSLFNKYQRISVLIVSDGHESHSHMLKDILTLQFSKQIDVTIHQEINLSYEYLKNANYDIIIGNFPLVDCSLSHYIYVDNIPNEHDIRKIQSKIAYIMEKRNRTQTDQMLIEITT